ncbi:hypothetical protein VTK73DRAFT_4604 [Phialemonium thermophilum]|uniref:DUF7918 domain-containing protein n=1 Tax=Phialemonium thermophilum TaxID=223376 RepID=A0ABR3Y059_9PEZI
MTDSHFFGRQSKAKEINALKMPSLRGIDVFLFSHSESLPIPEYPHPGASPVRLQGLDQRRYPTSPGRLCSVLSTNSVPNAVQLQRTGPMISVYMASIPGSQFSVRYSVSPIPTLPCKYVFFKLLMNGRTITSWGIDTRVQLAGSVSRSLWCPGERWQGRVGIEGRSFVFASGQLAKSIAEYGGVVEIRVFRAKERKPRAPRLEPFRDLDNYGLAVPSTGLLENPEDTRFYEWHLIDPKDSPYATFRFHYRSRENLELLNLIPGDHPNLASPSQSTNISASATEEALDLYAKLEAPSSLRSLPPTASTFKPTKIVRHIVDSLGSPTREQQAHGHESSSIPLSLFNENFSRFDRAVPDRASKSYDDHPLPELPKHDRRIRSSSPSSGSDTPSLTPSVVQYADDERFECEDVEVGVTEIVSIRKLREKPRGVEVGVQCWGTTMDLPKIQMTTKALLERPRSMDSPGSLVTQRTLRRNVESNSSGGAASLPRALTGFLNNNKGGPPDEANVLGLGWTRVRSPTTHFIWMRRTPSPSPRRASGSFLSRLWSPRPKRQSAKDLFAVPLKDGEGSKVNICTIDRKVSGGEE